MAYTEDQFAFIVGAMTAAYKGAVEMNRPYVLTDVQKHWIIDNMTSIIIDSE